jgi:hypothetical protein
MQEKIMRSVIIASLSVIVLAGQGCGHSIQAKFDLNDDTKVAVLPARDPEFGGGIFASPRGREIAVKVTQVLAYELDADRVVEPERYLERFARLEREHFKKPLRELVDSTDPSELTDQEIADKLDNVDYVVFIDIESGGWGTRPPGSVNLLRGRSKVTVKVYDNRGLKLKLLGAERVRAGYPTSYYERDGITAFDGDESRIETGLIGSTARQIALLFFDHDEDEGDNYGVRYK